MNTVNTLRVCRRCVMDTSDKMLTFDENGICSRCREYEKRIAPWWTHGVGHEQTLNRILHEVRSSGKDREYDCILGLSGGLDSCYLLHLAVTQWNLRPYVLHVDAGWNLPAAESNIRKLCGKLGVELHVKHMDFDEIRQMQLAFFRTGHAGLDVPQDHAFIAQVDSMAEALGVKYILNGYNISTELVANPVSWYDGAGPSGDKTYLLDVMKQHGGGRTKQYLYTTGFRHKFWLPYIKGVKTLTLLNYVPLTKEQMTDTLVNEYGLAVYRQKHFENLLTKFIDGWWLPTRFGYDIRRAQLSSLVITGQMTREEALEILKTPPLTDEEAAALFSEVARRLDISEEALTRLYTMPHIRRKYRSQNLAFALGIRLYALLGLDRRIRQ